MAAILILGGLVVVVLLLSWGKGKKNVTPTNAASFPPEKFSNGNVAEWLYQLEQRERDLKNQKGLLEQEMQKREQTYKQDMDRREQALKLEFLTKERAFQRELDSRSQAIEEGLKRLEQRDDAFRKGFCQGRQWLADFIAESHEALDRVLEDHLRTKKVPAHKAAEAVKEIRREKRQLLSKVKFLEFQLRSYEEYFPFLEDYRAAILDETVSLSNGQDNLQAIEDADPVVHFMSSHEYARLPPVQRNQLALQRYLDRSLSNWELGRLYERCIGQGYECSGWRVVYEGAIKGYEDFGRDLICSKGNTVRIVQCKCWSKDKVIREKHIFQLFGTTILYRNKHRGKEVIPEFCTTTALSPQAQEVATALGIEVRYEPLNKQYSMIKCNINPATKERIYHLPFDQQYDRVVIGNQPGERYVMTTEEAERLGFRRAFRHTVIRAA